MSWVGGGGFGGNGEETKEGRKDFDSHPVMNWSLDHAEEAGVLSFTQPRSKETLDDSNVI